MPKEKLRQLVASLHKELAAEESLDAESRALLEGLAGDIDALVGAEPAQPEHHESALEQVEEAAVRFETGYPRLAGVLQQITDALGRLGI